MAQLIVRNIEEEVVRALKERAGRRGHSAEAEHRRILREALVPADAENARDVLLDMPDVGTDSDFDRIPDLPRSIDV